MFKIESYFGPLLMSYLNKYVKLEEESFKLSLWGGDVTFHNLELQYDILEDLMPLPIGFKSGQVHELKVHVPWTKLGSESVVITLNTVECILSLKTDFVHKAKKSDTKNDFQNPSQRQKLERNIPPGYLKSYIVNILNNIHIKVNNLIIKFVEDDIVLSMNAKSLEYLPLTENWTRGFIDFSTGNLIVHKVVQVSDLTVCLDQMDSNGHIEQYQEPILYRCSVDCRFILSYKSFSSSKPDYLKFNIKFNHLELNITVSQMQMVRRLAELFYALYYNTINWDAVVGCGFSNQVMKITEKVKETEVEVAEETENYSQPPESSSWGSWAWSYVPSLFSVEDEFSDDSNLSADNGTDVTNKKTLIFGIYFDSMQINLKKTQMLKKTRRKSRSQKTILFMTMKGNNIGLNVTSRGLGLFNIQLGCTDMELVTVGDICPCGQNFNPDDMNYCGQNTVLSMGSPTIKENIHDLYLTGSLFSTITDDKNVVDSSLDKLYSITSQETYSDLFSQDECLKTFGALWFDYVYCMQIVTNSLEESQIDLSNLCNTDGIRESSVINLYVGTAICNINSYSIHNFIAISKALDISKYLSYFRTVSNDDRRSNVFYPTEDQVARIHEFVPLRHYNISLTHCTIKIHTFIESHTVSDVLPVIELKTKFTKISKIVPMYPRHLIDCVGVLNTNLLKESKDLLNKCYISKSLEINCLSMSFLIPNKELDESEEYNYLQQDLLKPCNISFTNKTLLFSDSWKTSSFTNDENTMTISNIDLKLIASHVKTAYVVVMSHYAWIINFLTLYPLSSNVTSMNSQLDDITLRLIHSNSSLIEACLPSYYQDKTFELHASLPDVTFKGWRTQTSHFIDMKISHDKLLVYLKEPLSTSIIPVLDNQVDRDASPLCLLYCQIPTQTKSVHLGEFSFHCQIGSINCMFSSHLMNWIIFPEMDFEMGVCYPTHLMTPPFRPRENIANMNYKVVSDTRSTADGNSRPESPSIFCSSVPVPGLPRSIKTPDNSFVEKKSIFQIEPSSRSGWWNMFKDGCAKYFFFLQSLDVCIKVKKSKVYVMTVKDSLGFPSNAFSCCHWVQSFSDNNQCSIFLITIHRLALINSQRKEYLDDNFDKATGGIHSQQSKSASFIESLPWELIFHDIQVDCIHSPQEGLKCTEIFYDSILKPVSINCTLSATPKCSSPERLDTLYSISWGVHVDITEVQPTLKQIYLIKLLDFFVTIFLNVSSSEFMQRHGYLLTGHYGIVNNNRNKVTTPEETPTYLSKHSVSTKSTKKSTSLSGTMEQKTFSPTYRIVSSKLETQCIKEVDTSFKLSFWIQCTLSQFQFIILLNDQEDQESNTKNRCLVMQVDDVTGSIDVQEKFVEIKSKFGSIFCQLGVMKDGKIVSGTSVLKSGSKFLSDKSFRSKPSYETLDDLQDSVNRHCLSVAIVRTTVNNLSQRPLSTYHQFKDTDSFQSYPTEFTGNFSIAPDAMAPGKAFVTQISSIVEPFELVISSYCIEQCHKLIDRLYFIYLEFFQQSDKIHSLSNKMNASIITSEPNFISEDMTKFHFLIKSSKIIMPCYTKDSDQIPNVKYNDNECIILTWNKISLQPFSDNPISRPGISDDDIDNESYTTKCENVDGSIDTDQKHLNTLDDNRQFQMDITNCGIYFTEYSAEVEESDCGNVNYDISLLKSKRYNEAFGTSIFHGQNPAFEWNNFSKSSSHFNSKHSDDSQLKAILKPLDIQIIFAGALYQNSDIPINRQILGGYGLEVNVLTSVEFLLDIESMKCLNLVSANLNRLFSYENCSETGNEKAQTDDGHLIGNLDDWIVQRKLEHIVPCVPTNILVTTRKVQLLLFLQNQEDQVNGICLSISQPHLLLYFKSKKCVKLEVSLFDVSLSVAPTQLSQSVKIWRNSQSLILAEMKNIGKTKSGQPDLKTGVPKSFITLTFSDFYIGNSSKLKVNIERQILVDIDVDDIKQMVDVITTISGEICEPRRTTVHPSASGISTPFGLIVPQLFNLCSEFVSLKFSNHHKCESSYELKFGTLKMEAYTLKNIHLNNLQSSIELRCDTVLLTNAVGDDVEVMIQPFPVIGKCVYRLYRLNSTDNYWTSSEVFGNVDLGSINLSIDRQHLITLYNMAQAVHAYLAPVIGGGRSIVSGFSEKKCDDRFEMFYDDLRSERFQINTKMIIETSGLNASSNNVANNIINFIADDGTVSFSDDGEDVAAMYWTYPETRIITCVEVMPVPFVFIECKFAKGDKYEQLQIPCQLEYWSYSRNCYELYRKFQLSENQIEKINDLPSVENLAKDSDIEVVAAKSWRVVFDCYARYRTMDDEKKVSYSEKAMLVYLSPLVLAASMKVDSCYAPSILKSSFISISLYSIKMAYRDQKKIERENKKLSFPFTFKCGFFDDNSIVDHSILCTVSLIDLNARYFFRGDVSASASNVVFHIANPFVALTIPTLLIEDISLNLLDTRQVPSSYSSCNLNIKTIWASIDQTSLRQLIIISENLKELMNILLASKFKPNRCSFNMLLFCNLLDRRIRLRQNEDSFYKVNDNVTSSGIASGEAVILKFLPTNYGKFLKKMTQDISKDPIKMTLGLCSELKGTVRWTESIEIPHLNYDDISTSKSNMKIWNIDCFNNLDTPICSNSSNLSNSYNARNLILLHNQSINGLNKLILLGNTVFNNLTDETIHVNFSLPTELSSGFSVSIIPSTSTDVTSSIHINWKVVTMTNPKNVFEASFRIGNGTSDIEYRSVTYRMTVPTFNNSSSRSHYHHSVIKLKEHKRDSQVVTPLDQSRQFICTAEWFQLNQNEHIFLMMTLSPMVLFKNVMLHEVRMHLKWIPIDDHFPSVEEVVSVSGNGGCSKLINFFDNKHVEVNASFVNDSKLLFDKPLILSEASLMESINTNISQLHGSHVQALDCENMRQHLSNRLMNIIDKVPTDHPNISHDNPFSVTVAIMPWLMLSNKTKMNLVLGFNKNVFLMEPFTDFVPPQYEKPIKVGITCEKEIFWSQSFVIGNNILKQNDNDVQSDISWNIIETNFGLEAYVQININLGNGGILPITLKHAFARKDTCLDPSIHLSLTRYNHITIESSVYISNQTKCHMNVFAISATINNPIDLESPVDYILVSPFSNYISVERFLRPKNSSDSSVNDTWMLCFSKTKNFTPMTQNSNIVSIINFKKLPNFRDSQNVKHTGFVYVEDSIKDCGEVQFAAFVVTSTLDYKSHKIFVDIFECPSIPIKIVNHSRYKVLMNEYEFGQSENVDAKCIIKPLQSIPFWPNDFLVNVDKVGCGQFNTVRLRLGVEQENGNYWSDYFPISRSQEPTRLDLVMNKSHQKLLIYIESSVSSTIIVSIYNPDDTPVTIPNTPIFNFKTNISIKNCIFSILECSHDLEVSDESLRLTLGETSLLYAYDMNSNVIHKELSISDAQLDNKHYSSGLYDFPVIIYSKNPEKSSKFLVCKIETDTCCVHTIDLTLEQEIEIYLENVLLYDMLRIFARLSQCLIKDSETSISPIYSSSPINLGVVHISSIPLIVTVHAFLKVYVSCEATSLSLPKFLMQPAFIMVQSVQKKLYEHYVTAALVRCGWVMGSFELLGNPSGIVNHLTTGFSKLLCSKNIDHGLLVDFLLRVFSFCRFTTGGLVSSFTGIASSVSRNLDYLCLDNTHIIRQDSYRRQYQPDGVIHGLLQGVSGFALSMLGAIAGLADHPLQASQEALDNHSSVTLAILRGLGKGIIGVLTKPLSGTAELFAQTGRGLLRTTGIVTLRSHCSCLEDCSPASEPDLSINERKLLAHFEQQEGPEGGDRRAEGPLALWAGLAVNPASGQWLRVLVTGGAMVLWPADGPLRDQHRGYSLCRHGLRIAPGNGPGLTLEIHPLLPCRPPAAAACSRISAFLSDQLCPDSDLPAPLTDQSLPSSASSVESAEFVKVPEEDGGAVLLRLVAPGNGLLQAVTFARLDPDGLCQQPFVI